MAKQKMSTFERLQSGKMNRKQRRKLGRQLNLENTGLEVVHLNAGGIDIGKDCPVMDARRVQLRRAAACSLEATQGVWGDLRRSVGFQLQRARAERNAGHDRVRRMLVPLRVHLLVQAAGGQVVPSDR